MPFTLQVAPLIIGYMLYSLQSLLQVRYLQVRTCIYECLEPTINNSK